MAWGLGLLGVALGLNTIVGSIYTRRQIEQSTATLQSEIATLTAQHIETYISRKIERLQDASSALALHPIGSSEQRLLAHLLLKNDRSFNEISILDARGLERMRIAERKAYVAADLVDRGNSALYWSTMRGENFISPVYTSNRAEPYLVLAVPLRTAPHQVEGALVARTNLKFLWEVVREKKFNRAGYIYLINETGDLIAHQDSSLVLKRPNLMRLPKVRQFLASRAEDEKPATRGMGIAGDEVLATYAPVKNFGWSVVVEEPVALALAEIERLSWFTTGLFAAGLLLGAAIIVWLSNKITSPILALRQGVEIIEKGNLSHRVKIDTYDEIAELGEKFNQMADALKTSHETLEKTVELRTREVTALYNVTNAVNQSLITDNVLKDVIKQITERFHFDTTRIFLFDGDSDVLVLKGCYNADQPATRGVGPFRKGHSIVGRVAESGEAIFFENTAADPRYHSWSESKASQSAGFNFLAVLPIKTQSRIFGAAAFSGREARRLNEDDARLLNAMCAQVAVAVEKAHLFEEVKRRNEDLQRANLELQEALRVKSHFIAGMSHELRTPLNVIMGYTKMTREGFFGDVNRGQKDALDKISHHADVLLKMVNNVLSLSRLEARESSLDLGRIDPEELIAQIKAHFKPYPRQGTVELRWDIGKDVPWLITDPLKLEEILQNLVGNAIKFTSEGRIDVRVRHLPNQGRVEFSVADTGIGIEESELSKIFNAFEQGKEAHTGNLNGVGLGLSLVKRYLELMHGEIRVTSQPGKGSTFTFSIPSRLDHYAQAAA